MPDFPTVMAAVEASRPIYAALCAELPPRYLRTAAEYEAAVARVESLKGDPAMTVGEGEILGPRGAAILDYCTVLALLAVRYQAEYGEGG